MGSYVFAQQISQLWQTRQSLLRRSTALLQEDGSLWIYTEAKRSFGSGFQEVQVKFTEREGGERISLITCAVSPQHSSVDGFAEPPAPPTKSASRHSLPRCRNSFTSTEEHPHIGNYRLLKTIGKGNFAKVKLARHVLTGREVRLWFINDLEDDVVAEIFIIAELLSKLLMSPTVTCTRA